MKKCLLFIFISIHLFPQADYVDAENRVYEFLERMDNLQIIDDYSSFEIPKTRKEIAKYLLEIISSSEKLDKVDLAMIEDFKIEFEYELFGTLENSKSLIGESNYNTFSQDEKYFYYFRKKNNLSLFFNLLGSGEIITNKNTSIDRFNSASLLNIGGELRGSVLNNFSFYLKGTNGIAKGNRNTALLKKELQYNFKFNEKPDETFYDETSAYIAADFDLVKMKLGRDRLNIGYGVNKSILNNNSPMFDYLSLNINYDFFNFSYFHGKLLGEKTKVTDSLTGLDNYITEKYLAYHRLGFDISPQFKFGLGEIVVYGDRPIDLSYLVPFSFFKSIEHSNRDRDNTMLFFDFLNYSLPQTKIFLTLLFDDISFGKIGTGWWGNQTMLNLGLHTIPLYKSVPLDFQVEYMRIEPYTYSHRFKRNNYTHFGYNLASDLLPNSELFFLGINYRFTSRLALMLNFTFTNHGANIINPDGTIINVGGDINLGHRTIDSENVNFLDGRLEIMRKFSTKLFYEPYNQISFFVITEYFSNSSVTIQSGKSFQLFVGTQIKL